MGWYEERHRHRMAALNSQNRGKILPNLEELDNDELMNLGVALNTDFRTTDKKEAAQILRKRVKNSNYATYKAVQRYVDEETDDYE